MLRGQIANEDVAMGQESEEAVQLQQILGTAHAADSTQSGDKEATK